MADLIQDLQQALGQPVTPAEPTPDAAPAAPVTPDPYADYLAGIDPVLHPIVRPALEAAHTKWDSEAAPKAAIAQQMEAFAEAMRVNPRGTLAFLSQHYNVPVRFDDGSAPQPAGLQPQPTAPTAVSEVEAIKRDLLNIPEDAPDRTQRQIDALDRLSIARAREMVAARVGTLEQAQLSLQEQGDRERLKRDYPDVDIDRLWPQITRTQQVVRERPYLAPDEAMAVHLFKPLVSEVRRLRGQLQRPVANEARAQVAGPTVGAPTAQPASLDEYTVDQLRALLAPMVKQ